MRFKVVLHKTFWFFYKAARTSCRFVLRPKGRAIKVLIKHENEFLLVRPTYAHKLWTIAGGGIEGDETPEQAARREVLEEVGLRIIAPLYFGDYIATVNYRTDIVSCFVAEMESKDFKIDGVEIWEAMWFTLENLPKDRVDKVVAMYRDFIDKRYG